MRDLSTIFILLAILVIAYIVYTEYIKKEEEKKNNTDIQEKKDETVIGDEENNKEKQRKEEKSGQPYLEVNIPNQIVAGTNMTVIIKAKNLKGTTLLVPDWQFGTGNFFEAVKLNVDTDNFSTVTTVKTKYLEGFSYPAKAKFIVKALRGGTETIAEWHGELEIHRPKNVEGSEDYGKYFELRTIPRLDGDTLRVTFEFKNKWGSPIQHVTFEEVKLLGSESKTYDVKIITREVKISHTFTYTHFKFSTHCGILWCKAIPEKKKYRIKMYNWKNELLTTVTKIVTINPDGYIEVSGEGVSTFPKPRDDEWIAL